jgi:hypothetical protein
MIGKLKRSLKERCPLCGKILQIRVLELSSIRNGVPITTEEEYISCSNPNCDYERAMEQKRRRQPEEILI